MNKTNKRSGTLRRLLSYIVRNSRWMFAVVCIAVVLSTAASVLGSMLTQVVIDDYITPLLTAGNPDYSGLRNAILGMGCIYLIGVICTFLYNRLMVTIADGRFLRTAGPHFPDSPGHIKRTALRNSRAESIPPC